MTNRLGLTRRLLLGTSLLAVAGPVLADSKVVYKDPSAPIPLRVKDLLSRMTIDEKVAQLRSRWITKGAITNKDGSFSPEKAVKAIPNGIGQIARPGDNMGNTFEPTNFLTIEDTVAFTNSVQKFLVENTRLGIPALFHDELAHGLLAKGATIFPTPMALASTWAPDLVEQVFTVASKEARLRGTTIALTPVLDLARDPRYGRVEEFFGEDPILVAEMGTAAVRGLQGRDRPLANDRVYATLKHFVHGIPQGGLNISPFDVSERMLREQFLVPFEHVIKSADPAIIMPSYNEVGGVPSHANYELLVKTGRERLGFRGVYISDYDGIGNLVTQHHVVAEPEDAARIAINLGISADLPDGMSYATLPALVKAGRVSESQIDAALSPLLTLKFEAGLFEAPYVDLKRAQKGIATQASAELARTTAEKSIILLKNEGAVPLQARAGLRIAVIGPNSVEPLYGGYSGSTTEGVGIFAGIKNKAPAGVIVDQADGVWLSPPNAQGNHLSYTPVDPVPEADNRVRIAQAIELAKRSDVVILVLGDIPALTREAVALNLPGDRSTLDLYGMQNDLVEAMARTGKPIVSLLINGRPLTVDRLTEVSNALFEGWYLGQEGGTAFANILFGNVNPSGKLTVSIPRSIGQLPVNYNRHPSADVNTYIEGPRTPLFAFGHGLSYTTFDIAAPRFDKASIGPEENVAVEIDVTNTGSRSGDEVVQLYIRDEVSSVPRPILELKKFQRISLAPGERKTVTFVLTPDDLAFWNIDMKWIVEPGNFTISAGSASDKLKSTRLIVEDRGTAA